MTEEKPRCRAVHVPGCERVLRSNDYEHRASARGRCESCEDFEHHERIKNYEHGNPGFGA
jgi:hypothetical protein